MSSTRNTISPGVFAADAVTVIPSTPSSGTAYRDTETTQQQSEDGWKFNTLVNSATFNQILYQVTDLLKIIDTQGLLGWSDRVEYGIGALVLGSDRQVYRAIGANGPTAGLSDPAMSGVKWQRFGAAAATNAEVVSGVEQQKFVSPATVLAILGQASASGFGFLNVPVLIGGTRFLFTLQWMQVTTGGLDVTTVHALPGAFTNANLFQMVVPMDSYGAGRPIETMPVIAGASLTTVSIVNRAVGDNAVNPQGVAARVFCIGF